MVTARLIAPEPTLYRGLTFRRYFREPRNFGIGRHIRKTTEIKYLMDFRDKSIISLQGRWLDGTEDTISIDHVNIFVLNGFVGTVPPIGVVPPPGSGGGLTKVPPPKIGSVASSRHAGRIKSGRSFLMSRFREVDDLAERRNYRAIENWINSLNRYIEGLEETPLDYLLIRDKTFPSKVVPYLMEDLEEKFSATEAEQVAKALAHSLEQSALDEEANYRTVELWAKAIVDQLRA